MNQEFKLPPDIWETFARENWEKKPFLLRKPFAKAFTSPGEIFEICQEMMKEKQQRKGTYLYTSVKKGETYYQTEDLSPPSMHRSIEDYLTELKSKIGGEEAAMVASDLQMYSVPLYEKVRTFLHDLFLQVGIPLGDVNVNIFAGDYAKSPDGVHKDPTGIFMYMIRGEKKMHTWSSDFWENNPDCRLHMFDYERHLDHAVTLDLKEGDLGYWPSHSYHIGETSDFALSLHIGMFVKRKDLPQYFLMSRLLDETKKRTDSGRPLTFKIPKASTKIEKTIPPLFRNDLAQIRRVASSRILDQVLPINWLARVSALGFRKVPPPLPSVTLTDNQTVQVQPTYPIYWWKNPKQKIMVCACRGLLIQTRYRPQIPKLLALLNMEGPHNVGDLVQKFGSRNSPQDLRKFLSSLVQIRGLQVLV